MPKFGLIGKSLSHSFSKTYFTEKFAKLGLDDHEYHLFELDQISDLKQLLSSNQLKGLNVTIPYKEAVIPYLDHLSVAAQDLGAVNTIVIRNGELYGHNTDIIGFAKSIKPFFAMHHERALILGSGGAEKAIKYVLKELGVRCLTVSRNPSGPNQIAYTDLHEEGMKHWNLVINCTPVGTYPDIHRCPNIPYSGLTQDHFCVDLIYNPKETLFLQKSKNQGAMVLNGHDMLQFQADASWELWNKK